MQYIAAFFSAVGFVGTCIGIYAFYSNHPGPAAQRNKMLLGIITTIFLLTFIFAGLSALGVKGVTGSISPLNNGQLETNSPKQITPTATSTPTPSPTAMVTPSPTPTPVPKPGTVLYQASTLSDWSGWALSADWKAIGYNNLLINDGSSRLGVPGGGPTAVAPYNVTRTLNFAVEVRIKSTPPNSGWAFGINVCGSSDQGSWTGYMAYIISNGGVLALIRYPQHEVSQNFDPGTTWHTYRVEVRANSIALLIDGATIATATDATYLTCGEQVGLWSDLIPISVSSFKVITL